MPDHTPGADAMSAGDVQGVPMWCDGCRATGALHCAHPDQCGNMLSATAAADQWKAWLDDLPLPFTFDPAIGRLQDFITALTSRIDVPQPANPRDTALADLAAARDQIEALRGALEACVASLERADTEEGVCCCGDSMDRHSDPMSCGHSPVDMGDYYAGQALKSARAALTETKP